jgi:argininosuccinate lyase
MSKKLWQTTSKNSNSIINKYTASDDIKFDQQLIAFDIYGSLAHAQMLLKQNLISKNDHQKIKTSLLNILTDFKKDDFHLKTEDEDVHTKIENIITQHHPQAGKKLHTGRSRNDQVLLDIRLYSKTKLITLSSDVFLLAENFLNKTQEFHNIPLPGMTHMQPAMLSSFGLWLSSFAESLTDDLLSLKFAYKLNDQSPLGSGAGYGVNLPLARDYSAQILGFSKVQNNSLYCQNSKGKIEAQIVFSLLQIMASLNKFATDSLLYTTEPFSFISFDPQLGTGSSIMPQKLNWDALELIRANYHQVNSLLMEINSSLSNLPSGYNRDSQLIKKSLCNAFKITFDSVQVAKLFIKSIKPNYSQIKKHIPKELFATHWAYQIMDEEQIPFREAYLYVKNNLNKIPNFDPQKLLNKTTALGSTGNLNLNQTRTELKKIKVFWKEEDSKLGKAINKLIN